MTQPEGGPTGEPGGAGGGAGAAGAGATHEPGQRGNRAGSGEPDERAFSPEPGNRVRRLVVLSAGLNQPSSTRLLAERLAAATEEGLREAGLEPDTRSIEVRDHAQDLVNAVLTLFPSPALQSAVDSVQTADGLIAATPIFTGSYGGLFKLFFDVLERGSLAGTPVVIAATGGTARHSLALDHAMRPLFAYLGALVMPTAVYAASEDWGAGATATDPALAERIGRGGRELAAAMAARPRRVTTDPFANPTPFEELLAANRSPGRGQRGASG